MRRRRDLPAGPTQASSGLSPRRALQRWSWVAVLLSLIAAGCSQPSAAPAEGVTPQSAPSDTVADPVATTPPIDAGSGTVAALVAELDALGRHLAAVNNAYPSPPAGVGSRAVARFDETGRSVVERDGQIVADEPGIYWDAQISESNQLAYLHTDGSNSASHVYVDATQVSEADGVLRTNLLAVGPILTWSEQTRAFDTSRVVAHRLDGTSSGWATLPAAAYQTISPTIGELLVAGFDPDQNTYAVWKIDLGTEPGEVPESTKIHDTANPVFLVQADDEVSTWEIESNGSAGALLFAYYHLYGPQLGEPFAFGNNDYGRLTWNVSRRIEAIGHLAEHRDPSLLPYLNAVVQQVVATIDRQDSLTTTKYSIDKVQRLNLKVSTAVLAHSLLGVADLLDEELARRVEAFAIAEFDRYELDWNDGYYEFTQCIEYALDGLPMPWNMQHAIGLLALGLYELTGEDRYLQRATELLANFEQSLVSTADGSTVWHYWPDFFYQGWDPDTRPSCNHPGKGPTTDELFSDIGHASIDIEFLDEMARVTGQPPSVSFDDIGSNVIAGDRTYSRFISGDVEYQAASYRFIPTFTETDAVAQLYTSFVHRPVVDFDNQSLFQSHAEVAGQGALEGTLRVTITSDSTTVITLDASNDGCAIEAQGGTEEPVTLDTDCAEFIKGLAMTLRQAS